VDNFVGKPWAAYGEPQKIRVRHRMLNSCAGKFDLRFKCLLMCDSTVKLPIGLRASIGAAVDFSARADIGLAHD
jgi:hypothetical protein